MAGWESVDGTTILNEDDLRDVRLAVGDLTARWKDLGISLGLRLSELNAMFSANSHSPSDCLRETLVIWLEQNYNVERFGKPTWRRLVKAVEDHVESNNCALAQKIAREHPDKKYRRLETLQHVKLRSEKQHKLTDSTDIFILPEYIRVMVSNYQPLQTVFATDKGECHTRQIKNDEQFSPTVTIVDAATKEPLDCVLLLHGDKPPEVTCRTLFCYIAVQVTVDPYYCTHDSQLYQVKSKPCKQGKLPLIFCFYWSGTVCIIRLLIHSIADSEGVEYMHNSEACDCIVQIINRNQHEVVKMTDRHGVVRIKEPPRLRYTGPLASKQFHKLERQFIKLYLSPGYEHKIQQLSKQILVENSISDDIKVFALCWEAISVAYNENYEHAKELLRTAWEKASQLECQNGLLLQAKILKQLAFMQSFQGNDDKALDYMLGAKERLFNAAPSNETAQALHTELRLKRRRLFSRPNCAISSELYKSTEEEYELLLEHAKHLEEYENPAICSFLTVKATFHLRKDLITDKLPPKKHWPSPDDLRKAEECLKRVPLHTMPDQSNFYTAKYYCAFCDFHIWKKQYSEAMRYVKKAQKLYDQMKLKQNKVLHQVDQRLKLLETLIGDEKIEEILKEY